MRTATLNQHDITAADLEFAVQVLPLTGPQRMIVTSHHGIGCQPRSLPKIAKALGIEAPDIRRMHTAVLKAAWALKVRMTMAAAVSVLRAHTDPGHGPGMLPTRLCKSCPRTFQPRSRYNRFCPRCQDRIQSEATLTQRHAAKEPAHHDTED